MLNINSHQALYFSQHKYFQQTQVVYQGDFAGCICVFGASGLGCTLMPGCFPAGVIPDETKALSLLAPANAVAGLLARGCLLPTPNPLSQIGAVPLAALGAPALDPALAALGLPGANLNSQSLAADQLLKLMSTVDPKLNHVAAGLVSPSLKSDTSSKEIEEAMKRVREAQSLISAAIEPDKKMKTKTFEVEVTLEEEEDTFLIQTQTLQEQIKEKVPFQIQKQEAIQKSEEKEISFQREEQEVSEHIQNQG